ncbi:hypothetical protein MNV49_006831 [Pseudohyphozyma bogoriensis]|nr:hypothetical protein MNV49_006831 [Pseudohyphozyma bogoriensis]
MANYSSHPALHRRDESEASMSSVNSDDVGLAATDFSVSAMAEQHHEDEESMAGDEEEEEEPDFAPLDDFDAPDPAAALDHRLAASHAVPYAQWQNPDGVAFPLAGGGSSDGLLTPNSATFGYIDTSHLGGARLDTSASTTSSATSTHDSVASGSPGSVASISPHSQSFAHSAPPPSFRPDGRHPVALSINPASTSHHQNLYSPHGTPYSPQPPSISPMTISTPAGGGRLSHSSVESGSPATPLSPYALPSTASGSSHSSSTLTNGEELTPDEGPIGMRTRHSTGAYVSLSANPDQGRLRLKRTHSTRTQGSEDSYAAARALALSEAAFIGPQTEVEAAASAAQSAAAKTGAGAGAFVYKVYYMLLDVSSQHLIAFTDAGTSFVVSNIVLFAKEVLPKHFKHNNFSSFVRQLNMYGFHKVNKTPRGQARNAETQAWEFNHPLFIRGKPQQLDAIKRKATDLDIGPIPPKLTRSTSNGDPRLDQTGPERSPVTARPERPMPYSRTLPPPHPGMTASVNRRHVPPPLQSATSAAPSQAPSLAYPSPHLHSPQPHLHSSQPSSPSQQQSHFVSQPYLAHPPYAGARVVAPPPLQIPSRSHSSDSRSGYGVQGTSRIDMLESQRLELSKALAGTQDGYEALYREFLETKKRQDTLIELVRDMYIVLQRSGMDSQLPYAFPIHLFAPGTFPEFEHPNISVTHADASSRHVSHSSQSFLSSGEPQFSASTYNTPQESPVGGHFYGAGHHETLYHPSQASDVEHQFHSDGAAVLNQQAHMNALLNPSARTPTLAPPAGLTHGHGQAATFSRAVNTPLPASPHPAMNTMAQSQTQGLVGLGIAQELPVDSGGAGGGGAGGGRYVGYMMSEEARSGEDVEMGTSSLSGYAGEPQFSATLSTSPAQSIVYGSRESSQSRGTGAESPRIDIGGSSEYYFKREEGEGHHLFGAAGDGSRMTVA